MVFAEVVMIAWRLELSVDVVVSVYHGDEVLMILNDVVRVVLFLMLGCCCCCCR